MDNINAEIVKGPATFKSIKNLNVVNDRSGLFLLSNILD